MLLLGYWVKFTATKATKQPVAGSNGLNVASKDAFVGAEDPKRLRYAKLHVVADPGEMSLVSILYSYARVLIALPVIRNPSRNLTRHYRPKYLWTDPGLRLDR